MTHRIFPALPIAAVLTVAALCLTACSPSGGESGPSPSSETDAPGLEAAAAVVEAANSATRDDFPRPTEAFEVPDASVAVIAAGLSGGGTASYVPYLKEASDAIGWEMDFLDGQYAPATQGKLMIDAAAKDYDGVILLSLDPSALTAGFEALIASGKKVVCVTCGPDLPEGVTPVSYSWEAAGQTQADWIITQSDGKAKTVVFNAPQYPVIAAATKAILAEFEANCPECEVTQQDFLIADALAPGSPYFSAFLQSHPAGTVDYISAPFDTAAAPWVQIATQAARTDLTFTGQGATNGYFEMVAAGDPPGAGMTITTPVPYENWAAVDLLGRLIADAPVWDASGMPIGIASKESAGEYDAKAPYVNPTFDIEETFKALWQR